MCCQLRYWFVVTVAETHVSRRERHTHASWHTHAHTQHINAHMHAHTHTTRPHILLHTHTHRRCMCSNRQRGCHGAQRVQNQTSRGWTGRRRRGGGRTERGMGLDGWRHAGGWLAGGLGDLEISGVQCSRSITWFFIDGKASPPRNLRSEPSIRAKPTLSRAELDMRTEPAAELKESQDRKSVV